jgi:hypothetical protein
MTRIDYLSNHISKEPSNTALLYRCDITGELIGDWGDTHDHINWMNKTGKYEQINNDG